MLRASVVYQGGEVDLRAATGGARSGDGDGGVASGGELTAFAAAAAGGDDSELSAARDALRAAAGSEALVDAAAVAANFQRMVRIADGAGISLDTSVAMLADDFRENLGLDEFGSAGRSAALGLLPRALAPVLRVAAHAGLRAIRVVRGLGGSGRRARSRASRP